MVTLSVRVQPGASADEVVGWEGELLRLRVRARAVEGRANQALVRFLATRLRLRPYQVVLLRGEPSREKLLSVDLPSLDELKRRLEPGPD